MGQFYCSQVQISACNTVDTIPQDAIVVNPSLGMPSSGVCYYICNSGFLKLIEGNSPGINNIYVEPYGTLEDDALDNQVLDNIIAKFPSTINLGFAPLNIKCDSGVIVILGDNP